MIPESRASAAPARNELPRARVCRLYNVRLHALPPEEVLDCVLKRDPQGNFAYIVTPNVDHVVRLHKSADAGRHLYEEAWLSLCDSTVLAILARMAGMHLPVVTGSDLVAAIFGRLQPSDRVVVIGCEEQDVETLRRRYGIAAIAHHRPPMGFVDDPKEVQACVDFVAAYPGRFVFLAVGSPQQEIVANHLYHCGRATGLGLCVGSSLRFLSGAERRAPYFARGSGFEWLFRLAQDPRRLWRRYLVRDPFIVRIALRHALSSAFDASTGRATRSRLPSRQRPRRR